MSDADTLQTLIRTAIQEEVGSAIKELRSFFDRRMAELSAEVTAAVHIMDDSEEKLSRQLHEVREQVGRLVAAPVDATRNSGLELEAVVQATEAAADRIMGAAEAITDFLQANKTNDDLQAIAEKVNVIFEACSFQDLTGQRVRRAIRQLHQVETALAGLTGQPEPPPSEPAPAATPQKPATDPDLAQAEIDRLLAN